MKRLLHPAAILVVLHAGLLFGVVFSCPAIPRHVSAAYRVPEAPSHGFDMARVNYGLPIGIYFVAERLWSVHSCSPSVRWLCIPELPAISTSLLLSALALPALGPLEPWARSWINLVTVLALGTLQWWLIGLSLSRLFRVLRSREDSNA